MKTYHSAGHCFEICIKSLKAYIKPFVASENTSLRINKQKIRTEYKTVLLKISVIHVWRLVSIIVDLQLKWPIWGFFLELMDQCEFSIFPINSKSPKNRSENHFKNFHTKKILILNSSNWNCWKFVFFFRRRVSQILEIRKIFHLKSRVNYRHSIFSSHISIFSNEFLMKAFRKWICCCCRLKF